MFTFLKRYITRIFALDYRSLAFLRIVLGLLVIYDVALGMRFLVPFHTDMGIMTLDTLRSNYPDENIWAFHSISNNYIYQCILFGLHMLVAVLFTIGRRTREMSVLLWLFVCSMLGHNPQIINGADIVVKMFLFRSIFLPMGARRSVDYTLYTSGKAYKNNPERAKYTSTTNICSVATVALVVQLCIIYIFTAILKDHPIWTTDYTAVYYALSLDTFVKPIGAYIYQFPEIMKGMTRYSLMLEYYGFLLLLIPRRNKARRMIAIFLFVTFHLGLHLTMRLETFPRVMIAGWMALLPSIVRERMRDLCRQVCQRVAGESRVVDYFCGLCSCTQESKKDHANDIVTTSPEVPNEMVVDDYSVYIQQLPWYITTFVLACLAYVLMRNIRTTDFDKYDDYFPRDMNRYGFLFRLDQYRNMFSPFPFVDDGWTVLVGVQKDGTEVNTLHPDLPLSFDKPAFDSHYEHEKRRKVFTNLWMKSNSQYREPMAQYFCRQRNKDRPFEEWIHNIRRYYVLEKTLDDYKTEPLKEVLLFEGECMRGG